MRAQEFITEAFNQVAEGLTEIENLPARNFDGKRMLRLRIPAKRNLQPLLGGTDLLYAVDQAPGGDPRVVIVEPGVRTITKPQIVAVLQLEPVNYLPNTVQVGFITVDEDYRGRGLAKALYGIVFTKMRKNLLSGDTQTPGGKRNWMSLVNMPGVQVKGLVQISNDIFDFNKNQVSSNYQKYIDQTIDQIMELGGQFFHKNKDFSFWLFDVVPGKGQLQPYVQNSISKLYGYDARNLLLATWNRGTNESQQDLAEDAESEVAESTSPSITVKDAKRALLAMGFEPTGRGKGSHDVWKDSSGLLFTIPVHGKDLEYGVAKTLLKLIRSRQTALEEMANTQLVTDDELPDLPGPKEQPDNWTAQTSVDPEKRLQRTQYSNLNTGLNLGISADIPGGMRDYQDQRGINLGYGPASVNIGDRGAVSGSYNVPIDDRSSVSLSASGQKDFGVTGVGAQYQRGGFSAGVNQPNFPGAKPQFNVGYSAKFEEALDEMAGSIHVGISQALAKKGYKYLGGGIDKQAYLEPNGQVYIVFGYRKGVDDFSPDQRMFINWIDYCNRHQDNAHLPRFSAFETFKFQGKNYIQARMETLQELPKTVGTLVGQIDQVTKQIGQGNFKSAYKKIKSYAEFAIADDYYASDYNPQYFEDIKEVVDLLGGPERADGLLKTVYEVSRFARKHNFTVDLHSGNYMQRPDGTIVVNDPFVIWERNL